MVAATANPDLSSAETLTDDALIAEIAPAMMEKFRLDAKMRNSTNVVLFLLAITMMFGRGDADHSAIPLLDLLAALAKVVFGLVCVITFFRNPKFFQPEYWTNKSIAEEITYRRQHGKWRWDH